MPTDKLITALGKAVVARWGELPVELQQTLFEAAIELVGEGSRGKPSVYLHAGIAGQRQAKSQGEKCPSPIALAGNPPSTPVRAGDARGTMLACEAIGPAARVAGRVPP